MTIREDEYRALHPAPYGGSIPYPPSDRLETQPPAADLLAAAERLLASAVLRRTDRSYTWAYCADCELEAEHDQPIEHEAGCLVDALAAAVARARGEAAP